ncbi:MAG: hypothetical protein LBL58_14705 [Tannerellaceae bacterium]|jgi:hypothetical protein|nr:hypothetical protein [Tannerellaceae bacterium]
MKKILLLSALLSVFLISCSGNNDDVVEEEDQTVDLLFNEPLIMYGCSVEEVQEAETRKNPEHIVLDDTYQVLYYEENKNSLEYVIRYNFQNNILYLLGVEFKEKISAELFDALCSSLAEKYEENSEWPNLYFSEEFTIWTYYRSTIRFDYSPNGYIEGFMPII